MQDTIIPSDLGSPTGNEKHNKRDFKKEDCQKGIFSDTTMRVKEEGEFSVTTQTREAGTHSS